MDCFKLIHLDGIPDMCVETIQKSTNIEIINEDIVTMMYTKNVLTYLFRDLLITSNG